MSNYAIVINNVVEGFIHMTKYSYENSDANLKQQLVEETANTGTIHIGGTYDSGNNIFIPVSPYPSWSYDKTTLRWTPPTPRPDEGNTSQQYSWDETNKTWVGNGVQVKLITPNT